MIACAIQGANDHLRRGRSQAGDSGGDDIGDINRLDDKGQGASLQPDRVEKVRDQATEPAQGLIGGVKQFGRIVPAQREIRQGVRTRSALVVTRHERGAGGRDRVRHGG